MLPVSNGDLSELGFRDGHRVADDDSLSWGEVVEVNSHAFAFAICHTKRAGKTWIGDKKWKKGENLKKLTKVPFLRRIPST